MCSLYSSFVTVDKQLRPKLSAICGDKVAAVNGYCRVAFAVPTLDAGLEKSFGNSQALMFRVNDYDMDVETRRLQ